MTLEARAAALIPEEYHSLVIYASLALQRHWIETGEIKIRHAYDWNVRRDTVFSPPLNYTEIIAEGVGILKQFRAKGQMQDEETGKAFLMGFVISRREGLKKKLQ